jgi:hypothetical protein
MIRALKILALLAFLTLIPAVSQATPKGLTGLPFPQKAEGHPLLVLKAVAVPAGACPGASVHCVIATWTASTDGAANPTLAYNFYLWPAAGAAPSCANGATCTGVAPANGAPIAAGCSSACGFTDVAVVPGKYNVAVTAVLNGSESALSNVIALTIAPAAPVLSGSGQ